LTIYAKPTEMLLRFFQIRMIRGFPSLRILSKGTPQMSKLSHLNYFTLRKEWEPVGTIAHNKTKVKN